VSKCNVVIQSTTVARKRDRKRSGKAKQRQLLSTLVIVGCIAVAGFFLGKSPLFPMLGNALQPASGSAQNQATPVSDSNSARQAELETQAKGYELVLQKQPEDQTALKELVYTRLELAQMGAASLRETIEPLEKLAKLNPDDSKYAVLLAQTKQHVGDTEGAATVFRSMLESKPGNIEALEGLVTLLMAQKRPEAAIGLLQDTLDTAPKLNKIQPGSVDEVSVRLLLASVYAEQQRYNEAIAIYDDAIKANKDDFRPFWGKAMVSQLQGKTDDAKALFGRATDLAPARYKDQIQAKLKQVETETSAPETSPDAESNAESSPQ
jgi:tetratricopeptide (TPR) repeat protein